MRAIAPINFSNPADKVRHDKMIGMVGLMLTAKRELAGALTDRDTEYWQRRYDGLDRQIDQLVYALYGGGVTPFLGRAVRWRD